VKRYLAPRALIGAAWEEDVCITVDEQGNFSKIVGNFEGKGAERLNGPVVPGMANLHSHAFQRAMAGLTEMRGSPHDDFWSWRELMYRFVERVTPAQAQAIARQLYIEMLRNGYTAVAEFHYVHNDPAGRAYAPPGEMLRRHFEAAREAQIAVTLLPSLYAWSDFGAKPLQPRQRRFQIDAAAVLKLVEAARRWAANDPDVGVGVSPHSLRAADPGGLRELVAGTAALEPAAPIHIHAAEQTKEVDDCLAWSGRRPVAWLLENMPVDARWCLVHATHLEKDEMRALAASGAVAGLCPTTEGNLGDGVFALAEYREAGGRYGIGGDSHVSRDPAEELRLLEYFQRVTKRKRNIVTSEQSLSVGTTLWREAAAGGAQALGRRMGAIAAGLRADLVVLEPVEGDPLNAFIFSGERGLVRDVMVGGRWVVRDRHHPMADEAALAYRQVVGELVR
jgi:formimidoylglutamate deiminase